MLSLTQYQERDMPEDSKEQQHGQDKRKQHTNNWFSFLKAKARKLLWLMTPPPNCPS